MSLKTMTIDQFKLLTSNDHLLAIGVYDQAIHTLALGMNNPADNPDAYQEDAEEMTSLITLRKLHVGALDDLISGEETDGSTVATVA